MATLQHPFEKKLDALAIRAARVCVDGGLHQLEARVVAAFDMGHGMGPAYRAGTVHELATAALALALRFDDDGVVPVWTFSDAPSFEGEMRRDDHVSFLMRRVLPPAPMAGQSPDVVRSRLAPVLHRIGESLFGAEWTPDEPGPKHARKAAVPSLVIVFTNGDCVDQAATAALLRYASYFPVFWLFVGVSDGTTDDTRFAFLRHLDVVVAGFVDCCGFFAPDVALGAEAVFTGLVEAFPVWLERPEVRAMLLPRPPGGPAMHMSPAGVIAGLDADALAEAEDAWASDSLQRIEREERRAARTVAEVAGAEAWPKAGQGGAAPDAEAHRGRTRPLAPSHWRLEAVRERPWELPEEHSTALGQGVAGGTSSQGGDAPPDDDSPAERLARIRRRRQERRD